jgi:hypothetical protein
MAGTVDAGGGMGTVLGGGGGGIGTVPGGGGGGGTSWDCAAMAAVARAALAARASMRWNDFMGTLLLRRRESRIRRASALRESHRHASRGNLQGL